MNLQHTKFAAFHNHTVYIPLFNGLSHRLSPASSALDFTLTAPSDARHVDGKVIKYPDHTTDSMRWAKDETNRRRLKQIASNEAHNIQPVSIYENCGTS